MGGKIDALKNLHVALVDCHFTMNYYGNRSPFTVEEFKEKVETKEDTYLRAKVRASIFLDDEANEIMSEALGAFRQASMAIWLNLPDDQGPKGKESYDKSIRNLDWKNFTETYNNAVNCLKEMLNPKLVKSLEKPIKESDAKR